MVNPTEFTWLEIQPSIQQQGIVLWPWTILWESCFLKVHRVVRETLRYYRTSSILSAWVAYINEQVFFLYHQEFFFDRYKPVHLSSCPSQPAPFFRSQMHDGYPGNPEQQAQSWRSSIASTGRQERGHFVEQSFFSDFSIQKSWSDSTQRIWLHDEQVCVYQKLKLIVEFLFLLTLTFCFQYCNGACNF